MVSKYGNIGRMEKKFNQFVLSGSSLKGSPIVLGIDVRQGRQQMNFFAESGNDAEGFRQHFGSAPGDIPEKFGLESFHSQQVIPPVGRRAEHRIRYIERGNASSIRLECSSDNRTDDDRAISARGQSPLKCVGHAFAESWPCCADFPKTPAGQSSACSISSE